VPLGAVPALSWCGEVSLGGNHIMSKEKLHPSAVLTGRPLHDIVITHIVC